MDVKSSRPWEHGPMKLILTPMGKTGSTDIYTKTATMMTLVHNAFIRAFNNIYHLAPNVPSSDYRNFLEYADHVYKSLHAHHVEEEEHMFPSIEKATGENIMQENVKQHEAFQDGLEEFHKYLSSLIEGDISEFHAMRLRQILDSFMQPLVEHLTAEIDTLMALSKYDGKLDLEQIGKESYERSMKTQTLGESIPILMLNHDRTYENGVHGAFPSMSAFMSWVLIRVATVKHWGWWKYATCDNDQKPRALPFGA